MSKFKSHSAERGDWQRLSFLLCKMRTLRSQGKLAVERNQFVIRSVFHNFALLQIQDPVAVANSGQTVGNNDAGTLQLIQRLRYLLLGQIVQCRCCFVEQTRVQFTRCGTCTAT